ncbi:unnamed protein product [Closterium sp. NIES-65]|nr:unnamed protein product [Closterium sp. NIES-65]
MDKDSVKLEEEANRRKCAEQQPREPDVRLTWLKEERRCGEDGGSEEAEGEGHEYGDEEEGEKEGDGEDEKEEGERGEIRDGKTENGEKREDGGKGEECGRGYGGVLKEREEGEEMEEGEEGEEREEGEEGERGEPSVVEALREEVEMERILRALAEDGMKAVEQQMERLRDEVSRYKGQHQRDTETVFQLQSSEWQALQEVQEEREQRRELETSLIYLHHTLLELLPPDLLTDPPVFHTYSHPPIFPPDLLSNLSETPSHLLTSDDHEDPCNPPMIPPGLLSNLSETPSHLLTTDGHGHPCDPSETSHKLPDLSKTPSQVVLPSDGHAYPSAPFETTQEPLDLPETPSSQALAEDVYGSFVPSDPSHFPPCSLALDDTPCASHNEGCTNEDTTSEGCAKEASGSSGVLECGCGKSGCATLLVPPEESSSVSGAAGAANVACGSSNSSSSASTGASSSSSASSTPPFAPVSEHTASPPAPLAALSLPLFASRLLQLHIDSPSALSPSPPAPSSAPAAPAAPPLPPAASESEEGAGSVAAGAQTGAGQRSPGGRVGLRGEGDGEEVHWVREGWLKLKVGGERAGDRDGVERVGRGIGRRIGVRTVGRERPRLEEGKEVASGTGGGCGRSEQQRMRCGRCEALDGARVGVGRGGGAVEGRGVDEGEKTAVQRGGNASMCVLGTTFEAPQKKTAVQGNASMCVLGNATALQPALPRSTSPKPTFPKSALSESALSKSPLPETSAHESALPPSLSPLVPVLLLARVACPCCQVEGLQWLCEGCGAKGRWDGERNGGTGYRVKKVEKAREEEKEECREEESEEEREKEGGRDGKRERLEEWQVKAVRGEESGEESGKESGEESGEESNKGIDRSGERGGLGSNTQKLRYRIGAGMRGKSEQAFETSGDSNTTKPQNGIGAGMRGQSRQVISEKLPVEEGKCGMSRKGGKGAKGGKGGKGGWDEEGEEGGRGGGSCCCCDDCAVHTPMQTMLHPILSGPHTHGTPQANHS